MATADYPLRKHFRQPAIYLRLPSQGQYYPPQTLDMPANQEIPVMPMTAMDEIIVRTPDALFNGSSTAEIIRSCVPAIRDPWAVPSTDLNALLTAVRLASYGHNMEIDTQCPACDNVSTYGIDLRIVLDQLTAGAYDVPMQLGDLEIYFAPLSYRQMNENSQIKFNDEKGLQAIAVGDNQGVTDDEQQQIRAVSDSIRRMTETTVIMVAQSIATVKTPDAMVTDPAHIQEFLRNCNKQLFNAARDRVIELKEASDIKPLPITCSDCQHEYLQPFVLDMSNFFESAS